MVQRLEFGCLGQVEILRFRSSVRKNNLQSVELKKQIYFRYSYLTISL